MFRTNAVEEIKINFLLSNIFFFRKSCFSEVLSKKYRAGQGTDDNMSHALCFLDKRLQTHTQNM